MFTEKEKEMLVGGLYAAYNANTLSYSDLQDLADKIWELD